MVVDGVLWTRLYWNLGSTCWPDLTACLLNLLGCACFGYTSLLYPSTNGEKQATEADTIMCVRSLLRLCDL
jgi:hypothetical protein